MKSKKKTKKKLLLNKETITRLNSLELDNVKGGTSGSCYLSDTCPMVCFCP
jgi:hypothetical protein